MYIYTYTYRPHIDRPNLFNPIKEPRRQSFERLLGRLKVTRVFVSSHLTHVECVIGYETIRRIQRQRWAAPIWKCSIRCTREEALQASKANDFVSITRNRENRYATMGQSYRAMTYDRCVPLTRVVCDVIEHHSIEFSDFIPGNMNVQLHAR